MPVELFTNQAATTVTTGGTTAPAAGTVETWTVASSATFPTASSTAGAQFRVVEDDASRQSEVVLVTHVSGSTWTVTRGAEGTTPVAHPSGFGVVQTLTSGVMRRLTQRLDADAASGWSTYTPVWTTTGTAPALGDGSLAGRYRVVGTTMDLTITWTHGTTTSVGTGTWFFSAPPGYAFSGTEREIFGKAFIGNGNVLGFGYCPPGDTRVWPYTVASATDNLVSAVSNNWPISNWAQWHNIIITGVVEVSAT